MFEGVLDEILTAKGMTIGCNLGQWMSTLPADDQERLKEMFLHPDLTADELVAVVRRHFPTSTTSLRRHRRFLRDPSDNVCGCL